MALEAAIRWHPFAGVIVEGERFRHLLRQLTMDQEGEGFIIHGAGQGQAMIGLETDHSFHHIRIIDGNALNLMIIPPDSEPLNDFFDEKAVIPFLYKAAAGGLSAIAIDAGGSEGRNLNQEEKE